MLKRFLVRMLEKNTMMNERFLVRMLNLCSRGSREGCLRNKNNGWKWYLVKLFIILFTRCLSVHLLKCFHINLRSICNVIIFCKMVHL